MRAMYFRKLTCAAVMAAVSVPTTVSAAPPPPYAAKREKFEDACDILRKPFERIRDHRKNKALEGAAKGALAGLLVGMLNNAGKPKEQRTSVLPWVIAGGVTGGVVGYVQSRAQQVQDRQELQRAIAADFREDMDVVSPLAQMIVDLGNCRRAQIYSVEQDFREGRIDGKEGRRRLVKLEEWIAKDDKAITDASKTQGSRVSEYLQAQRLSEGADPEQTKSEQANIAHYGGAQLQPAVYVRKVESSTATVEPDPVVAADLFAKARSGVNLRAKPDASATKLATIPYRSKVKGLPSETDGWFAIDWNGVNGFAAAEFFDVTRPPPPPPKPEPQRGVRKMTLGKVAQDRSTPRAQAQSAALSRMTAEKVREQNRSQNGAQIADLRSALI